MELTGVDRDEQDATSRDLPGLDVGAVNDGRDALADHHRTRKTSERVAVDIVEDIVDRGLRTGDHLPLEAAMVEDYGVSRASLREALRLLEVQGLIRIRPGPAGGPTVGTVDPANLARTVALYFHLSAATYGHLLATQALLEPICAGLAAQHAERATAMEPFLEPAEPRREVEYRDATFDLHRAVYELASNHVISLLTQAVTHLVTSHVVASMDLVELHQTILHEHADLARAIAGGRVNDARRLMATHFEAQHEYYRQRWPSRLAELIEWR
jgi:GntR family transcriptional repressor for pyruvate dehydrogenase complex